MPSPNPLPLDRPAELVGEWWLPGAPEQVVSGRLLYRPYEALRLEAVSAADIFGLTDGAEWLHGLTVDGRLVTLRDLMVGKSSINIPGGISVEAFVGRAFVGMHATSDAELRFHSLQARIANLTAWLDPPGLGMSGARTAKRSGYSRAELGRAPGGIGVAAWVDVVTRESPPRKALTLEAEQRGWVSFRHPRRPLTWAALEPTLETFRQFVALASGADVPLLELRGEATVAREEFGTGRKAASREPVWVLFQQRHTPEVPETSAEELLFRQSDTDFSNHLPLGRWFRRSTQLDPIPAFYVAALPTRTMFLEQRVLAFVQALEAYDFRRTGRERKLRAVIAGSVETLPAGIRKYVPAQLPELARDTRHFLTHFNPKYEAAAATGARLDAVARAMRLLLELRLLRDLGFPQRRIQALVEGNQRLVTEVQLGFGSI